MSESKHKMQQRPFLRPQVQCDFRFDLFFSFSFRNIFCFSLVLVFNRFLVLVLQYSFV